jgi:hypothetical protein
MKRILLLCLSLAAFVSAHTIITKPRVEPDETFHLELYIPFKELPQNRSTPQLITSNDFKLLGLDSAKKLMPSKSLFSNTRDSALVFTFEVKAPQKTGKQSIGSISWKVNGKQRTISKEFQITIFSTYKGPALEATLTPSKKSVYIGEQFGISYDLLIHSNNRGGSLYPDSVDFGNNFTSFRNEHPKIGSKPNEKSNENLLTIQFAWWLVPNKNGTLEIQPLKFKYTTEIEQDTVEKDALTPPISITALPLPTKGKPADFSGMVGSYKFSANFDRTKIKMGDTLTLAINISGDGAIGEITDPKIPDLSDFSWEPAEAKVNKKVEDTKVITTKNIKISLFPRKIGTLKIPAITYSWFNPTKKKYEKASAGPWTVKVE